MEDIVYDFVGKLPTEIEVVSGGALGIDRWAAEAAKLYGHRVREYLPDIKRYGSPRAFFERNTQIVDYLEQLDGILVAFLDRESCSGSMDTIKKAAKKDIPTIVYMFSINPFLCVDVDIPHQLRDGSLRVE